jgi:hypothetical protein
MDPTQSGVPTLAVRARVPSAQTTIGPAGATQTATGRASPTDTTTATGRAGALPCG